MMKVKTAKLETTSRIKPSTEIVVMPPTMILILIILARVGTYP